MPDAGMQLAAALRQAAALYESGQWLQCETVCKRVLDAHPGAFEALNLRGIIAAQTGRADEAVQCLARAVTARPKDAGAHNNHGLALLAAGRAAAAVQSFARALRLAPTHAEAHNNLGNALRELGRWTEALDSYDRAIALQADTALAHNNRGLVLHQLGRVEESLLSFDLALKYAPGFADAHCNRGDALHTLGRLDDALQAFDRAVSLAPDSAPAFNNLGALLLELRRPSDALACLARALQLNPGSANALHNRGNVLQFLSRLPEAVASYDAALAVEPGAAATHLNRANALVRMNQLPEALAGYARALELDSHQPYAYGTWLFIRARLCDWHNWEAHGAALAEQIALGKPVVKAFHLQALSDSEALLRHAAEVEVQAELPTRPSLTALAAPPAADKIRVGYFSADFRVHPVGILTAGLFDAHDRSRFETVAFSLGPDTRDPVRRRLEQSFDRFIDVRLKSEAQIVALARQLQIDIAVDLSGLTEDARPGVFALRAAPVQVGMIGFAGTMTPRLVDYLVADRTVIPPESRTHYGEKIIFLPHTYLVNDQARPIADRPMTRAQCGLPDTGVVFSCFNNSYKLTPSVFSCWMRILNRVGSSVLWLATGSSSLIGNLRREAQARGVDGDRIVFAERLESPADHLARHRLADLALDTLPFNGHSTTIDALWAGLPVLTCTGRAFPGRVATSLLRAMGLPELIAADLDQYEELAVQLAADPQRLGWLRQRLLDHRLTMPLFDTQRYTRDLECVFAEIHRRRLNRLPPEDIQLDVKNS